MTEPAASTRPDRVCPSCHRTVDLDARFCLHCGRGLPLLATGSPSDVASGTDSPTQDRDVEEADVATDAVVAADVEAARCPRCSARNHPERSLCIRCGVDLTEPDPDLAVSLAGLDAVPAHLNRRGGIGTAWVLPLAAIVLTVGVVVALLAALEVGPFTPTQDIPEATFDPARYPDEVETLALSDVATLTTRDATPERSFVPVHLVDNDPTTAWHGEVAQLPQATSEPVDLFLAAPAWVSAIVVTNGDQRSPDDYEAAGRVRRADIVVDGDVRIPVTLLDQGLERQILELEEPLLTTSVRLEIRETFPGQQRDDPALSGLAVRGHLADEPDATLAEQRRELAPAAGAVMVAG